MSETPDPLAALRAATILAILRADSAEAAGRAADALIAAGVRAIEFTFTTPDAAAALRDARERHDDGVLFGAGTVRTREQLEQAVDAGAQFLVTPHLDPELLRAMVDSGVLALPGVFTPSEVASALDAGTHAVKLFPAATAGLSYMKALTGPFPELQVVPTGGIAAGDVRAWLDAGAVAIGIGSELCPSALVKAERWDELTENARGVLAEAGV